MTLVKEEFSEALLPGIREWFRNGADRVPDYVSQYFRIIGSDSDSESFHAFGAVSPDAWDNFRKSGQIASVGFDRGYKTTLTADEFIVEMPVRRTLVEDNKYPQILDEAGQLGFSGARKRNRDAMSVFNNYSSASYVGGDAVALCSNSHPLSPHKTGTTQDNLYASTALTATNVETVRLAMMAYTDDVGELAGVVPDLLIVPPALENMAKDICEAEGQLDSADNNLNPQKGRFVYRMNPLLSSSTTWFMVDKALMEQSLLWIDRVPLDIYEDTPTPVYFKYVARTRYQYGWRDWRWIAGAAA